MKNEGYFFTFPLDETHDIIISRKLTSLEKEFVKKFKNKDYPIVWIGKYNRKISFNKRKIKLTPIWFNNYYKMEN